MSKRSISPLITFPMDLLTQIRQDYERFPAHQTYSLYAEEVFFKDPMTEFYGIKKYQDMIGTIDRFFKDLRLDLHDIKQTENQIRTDWTLSWTTPLPWRPRITISGWSELALDEAGLICKHIDYWHCTRWNVVQQHSPFAL
jgi:Uncharacterized conserved protein (DUF2358)